MSALGQRRNLVSYLLNLPRNCEVERLRGVEVNYQFELGGLLHGETGGFCLSLMRIRRLDDNRGIAFQFLEEPRAAPLASRQDMIVSHPSEPL